MFSVKNKNYSDISGKIYVSCDYPFLLHSCRQGFYTTQNSSNFHVSSKYNVFTQFPLKYFDHGSILWKVASFKDNPQ
uniref:Uncharacterized protein n=1 Tax=Lepeophtheirus salmonis TaxID=72036 RepID=A0A0K2T1Y9_LEPSM